MNARLKIRVLDKDGTTLMEKEFQRFPVIIGRADEADVRIEDPCVSRTHAEVRVGAKGFAVCNRSSNGIFQKSRHTELILIPHRTGTVFEIAGYRFELEAAAPAEAEAMPAAVAAVTAEEAAPPQEVPDITSPGIGNPEFPSVARFAAILSAAAIGIALACFDLSVIKVLLLLAGLPLGILLFSSIIAAPLALLARRRSRRAGFRDFFALAARTSAVAAPLCLAILGGMELKGDAMLSAFAAWTGISVLGVFFCLKASLMLRIGSGSRAFPLILALVATLALIAPPALLLALDQKRPGGFRMISWTDVLPPRVRALGSSERALHAALAKSISKARATAASE